MMVVRGRTVEVLVMEMLLVVMEVRRTRVWVAMPTLVSFIFVVLGLSITIYLIGFWWIYL